MSTSTKARLPRRVKAAYGFGLSAEGIKANAFNIFLLFYYQQVAGLDAALCGLALFIAMLVDAVTDPAVGVWSDSWRSRWGRRHPFMYASTVPLALCYLAIFSPPAGLGQAALFAWLLVFAVGARFAMTLFMIPHQSLVAELSDDYDERTTLQSLRVVFAWLFGLLNALMAYRVFLAATDEYPQGLLNPAGYAPFALFGAVVMVVTTVVSSLGTQRAALRAQPEDARLRQIAVSELPGVIREALASPSYRTVVIAGLCLFMGFGLSENLSNYINTFFWEFTSEDLSILIFVLGAAAFAVLVGAGPLASRFGKKRVALVAVLLPAIFRPGAVLLRVLDVLPENGDPRLLWILAFGIFFDYGALILGMTMIGAMIADVTDEHELRTGSRQEGLLFSGNLLMHKTSTGLGVLLSGLVLSMVRLPENAVPGSVPNETVLRLGVFGALAALVLYATSAFFFSRYDLDRARHRRILADLAARGS